MTEKDLNAMIEEKNRLVRENWQLRADYEACEEENDRYLGEIGKLTVELDAIRKRVHDAYIRDPGEGNPNTETGDPLLDRLLGIYTVPVNDGAGPLNDSYTFTRKFPPLPINMEAATEIKRLRGEVMRLRDLVSHCWVHSGFQDCGSNQMTSEMLELYRSITEAEMD